MTDSAWAEEGNLNWPKRATDLAGAVVYPSLLHEACLDYTSMPLAVNA